MFGEVTLELVEALDSEGRGADALAVVVESLDKLRSHFAEHGIKLRDGDIPDTLMIAPEDNLDCQMQFVEA